MGIVLATRHMGLALCAIASVSCAGLAQKDYVPPTSKQLENCLKTLHCAYPQDLRDATYEAIKRGQIGRVNVAFEKATDEQRANIVIGIQWSDTDASQHRFDHLMRSFLQASRPEDMYEDGRWNALQYLAARCDSIALHALVLGGASKDSKSLMRFPISSTEWAASLSAFGTCSYTPARDVLTYSLDAASLNAVDAAYQSLQKLYPGVCKEVQSPEDAENCYLKHWSEQEKSPH